MFDDCTVSVAPASRLIPKQPILLTRRKESLSRGGLMRAGRLCSSDAKIPIEPNETASGYHPAVFSITTPGVPTFMPAAVNTSRRLS